METRDVIYTFFEEIINKGRLDLVDELMTEDFVNTRTAFDTAAGLAAAHGPSSLKREGASGRDGFRQGLTLIRTCFADYRNALDELVVEGDRAAGTWWARGTHVETFLGIPATGKRLEMAESGYMTVRDGKLASFWGIGDELGVLKALGAVDFHAEGAGMDRDLGQLARDSMLAWDRAHLEQDESAAAGLLAEGFSATHRQRVTAEPYLDIHFRRGLVVREYACAFDDVRVNDRVAVLTGMRRIAGVRDGLDVDTEQFISATLVDTPDGMRLLSLHASDPAPPEGA